MQFMEKSGHTLKKEIQEIRADTCKFLEAFLKIPKDEFRFELFSLFPKNCCEFSSLLLAKYLIEIKNYPPKKVKILTGFAKTDKNIDHLWLEAYGVTIDITAHQFKGAPKLAIVEQKSIWHQNFKIGKRALPEISFEDYHDDVREDFEADYTRIISLIS